MTITCEKSYRKVCEGNGWECMSDVGIKDSLIVHALLNTVKSNTDKTYDEVLSIIKLRYASRKERSKCSIYDNDRIEICTKSIIFPRFYIVSKKERHPSISNEMVVNAGRLVFSENFGSTSMVQRRLKIGYNLASSIMDELCGIGVIGKSDGAKPRQVLVSCERELNKCFERLPFE